MSDPQHPDRLRWGEGALEERHERLGKLARNFAEARRLIARLKRARAGSEEFGPAEVAEVDRVHSYWQKEITGLISGDAAPDKTPARPEIPPISEVARP